MDLVGDSGGGWDQLEDDIDLEGFEEPVPQSEHPNQARNGEQGQAPPQERRGNVPEAQPHGQGIQGYQDQALDYITQFARPPAEEPPRVEQQARAEATTSAAPEGSNLVGSLFSFFNRPESEAPEQPPPQNAPQTSTSQTLSNLFTGLGAPRPEASDPSPIEQQPEKKKTSKKKKVKLYHTEFPRESMEKQVVHHLADENRALKGALTVKDQEIARLREIIESQGPPDDKAQRLAELEEKIRLLEASDQEEVDLSEEFARVKKLFELYKIDTKVQDITHLYTSAFYTQDAKMVLLFKAKLFQNIAKKAIKGQEFLMKCQERKRVRRGQDPAAAATVQAPAATGTRVFKENQVLQKENKRLKKEVEDLKASASEREAAWAQYQTKVQAKQARLVAGLKATKDTIEAIKNEQMILNTYARDLQHNVAIDHLGQGLVASVRAHCEAKEQDVQEARDVVYQKNKQISDLFMKQREQEVEFSEQLRQVQDAAEHSSSEQISKVVFNKNKEIGQLFNQKQALEAEAERLREEAALKVLLEEEIDVLKGSLKDLSARLQAQTRQAEEDSAELTHSLDLKDDQVTSLHRQLEDQGTAFAGQLRQQSLEFKQKESALKSEISRLKEDISEGKRVLASKEQSLAAEKSLLSQSQQEARDKQAQILAIQSQNEKQREQLAAAEKEQKQLRTDLAKSQIEASMPKMDPSLVIEFESLKQEYSKLKDEVEKHKSGVSAVSGVSDPGLPSFLKAAQSLDDVVPLEGKLSQVSQIMNDANGQGGEKTSEDQGIFSDIDELRNDMSKEGGWNDEEIISPSVLHSKDEKLEGEGSAEQLKPGAAVEILEEDDPWGQEEQISIDLQEEEEVKVEEVDDNHLNTITEMSKEDDQTIFSGHRKQDTILSMPSSPDEPVEHTSFQGSKSFVSPLQVPGVPDHSLNKTQKALTGNFDKADCSLKEDPDFNSSLFPESVQRGGDLPKELNETDDGMLNDDTDLLNLPENPLPHDDFEAEETGCEGYPSEGEAGEGFEDDEPAVGTEGQEDLPNEQPDEEAPATGVIEDTGTADNVESGQGVQEEALQEQQLERPSLNIISEQEEDHSEGESPYFAQPQPESSLDDQALMQPEPVNEAEEPFEAAEDGWDSPGLDPEMDQDFGHQASQNAQNTQDEEDPEMKAEKCPSDNVDSHHIQIPMPIDFGEATPKQGGPFQIEEGGVTTAGFPYEEESPALFPPGQVPSIKIMPLSPVKTGVEIDSEIGDSIRVEGGDQKVQTARELPAKTIFTTEEKQAECGGLSQRHLDQAMDSEQKNQTVDFSKNGELSQLQVILDFNQQPPSEPNSNPTSPPAFKSTTMSALSGASYPLGGALPSNLSTLVRKEAEKNQEVADQVERLKQDIHNQMRPQGVYEYAADESVASSEKEKVFAQTMAKPVIPRISLQECLEPDQQQEPANSEEQAFPEQLPLEQPVLEHPDLEEEQGENQWDEIEIEDPILLQEPPEHPPATNQLPDQALEGEEHEQNPEEAKDEPPDQLVGTAEDPIEEIAEQNASEPTEVFTQEAEESKAESPDNAIDELPPLQEDPAFAVDPPQANTTEEPEPCQASEQQASVPPAVVANETQPELPDEGLWDTDEPFLDDLLVGADTGAVEEEQAVERQEDPVEEAKEVGGTEPVPDAEVTLPDDNTVEQLEARDKDQVVEEEKPEPQNEEEAGAEEATSPQQTQQLPQSAKETQPASGTGEADLEFPELEDEWGAELMNDDAFGSAVLDESKKEEAPATQAADPLSIIDSLGVPAVPQKETQVLDFLPDFLDAPKSLPQKTESTEPSIVGVVGLPAAALPSEDTGLVGKPKPTEGEQTGWGDEDDEIDIGEAEDKGWGDDGDIDLENL